MRYILGWCGIAIVAAGYYAYARLLFIIIQRWRYNKSHNRKVFMVSMFDIPSLMIEFFMLPVIAIKWIKKRWYQ